MPLSPCAGLEEAQHLLRRARLLGGAIADVGAVEAGDEAVLSADLQMFDDLRPRRRIRRRGERNARHVGKEVHEAVEGAVFGPEIMAPLRKAVGLVDGDERERTDFSRSRLSASTAFPAPCRGGPARPARCRARARSFSAPQSRELSAAAFTPACRERRHLVFHQRDAAATRRGRCPVGPAPGSGSRATCLRLSASGRRRCCPRSHAR